MEDVWSAADHAARAASKAGPADLGLAIASMAAVFRALGDNDTAAFARACDTVRESASGRFLGHVASNSFVRQFYGAPATPVGLGFAGLPPKNSMLVRQLLLAFLKIAKAHDSTGPPEKLLTYAKQKVAVFAHDSLWSVHENWHEMLAVLACASLHECIEAHALSDSSGACAGLVSWCLFFDKNRREFGLGSDV